jgi:hypothetical protein
MRALKMTREEAEALLEKLDYRMKQDSDTLDAWYPDISSNGSMRFQWSVDEEDGPMEVAAYGTRHVDTPRPKTIFDMLGPWTNDRTCYPKEFIIALLTGELPFGEPWSESK